MQVSWAIQQLTDHGVSIVQLCTSVSDEQARVKPDPKSWSILEVINHLYDEEREDFRKRLDVTLHQPDSEWPPIDPEGWVTSRAYLQRDFQQSIANFEAERKKSIEWLASLQSPDLNRSKVDPKGFVFQAGDLLGSWVVHDLLTLRQLVELHYYLCTKGAAPYTVRYAGKW